MSLLTFPRKDRARLMDLLLTVETNSSLVLFSNMMICLDGKVDARRIVVKAPTSPPPTMRITSDGEDSSCLFSLVISIHFTLSFSLSIHVYEVK